MCKILGILILCCLILDLIAHIVNIVCYLQYKRTNNNIKNNKTKKKLVE